MELRDENMEESKIAGQYCGGRELIRQTSE